MAETRTTVYDGKYTLIHEQGTGLRALRHGEEWRDLTGDGMVLALVQEIEELREALQLGSIVSTERWNAEITSLRAALEKYTHCRHASTTCRCPEEALAALGR